MDVITSKAIIMRVREFGESDLLATFFTEDGGQLRGVAKGARKSRKRFVNCLDHFCLVNLEYGSKRKDGLCFLESGRLLNAYPGLRSDFGNLSRASYMIELTEVLFPCGVADREMFHLLERSFDLLAEGKLRPDLVSILFEIRAMILGGYGINIEKCCKCGRIYTGRGTAAYRPARGGIACLRCQQISAASPKLEPQTVKVVEMLRSTSSVPLDRMHVSDEIIGELKAVLKLHRDYHLGRRLKTSIYLE